MVDSLADGVELPVFGTDPTLSDTDADGLTDWEEVDAGSGPHSSMTRRSIPITTSTTNAEEVAAGTDATKIDTDADGSWDGSRGRRGTDPRDADTDDDLLEDGTEESFGSDPSNADSDNDA